MDDFTEEELADLDSLRSRNPDKTSKQAQYDFDKCVQQDILSLMIRERSFMVQAMHLIRSDYFVDKAHVLICKILLQWFEDHVKTVTDENEAWIQEKYIKDQLQVHLATNPAKSYYIAELQTILDCYTQGLTSRSYCMDRIVNFAKDQEIRLAISSTVNYLRSPDKDKHTKIKNVWDRAFLVGPQMDMGLNYFEDIEERYKRMEEDRSGRDRFSSGFQKLDDGIVGYGLSRGEIAGYQAMSGAGKCFAKNTPILMYNGTIKMVQDIVVGDTVMGNDSKPRIVLKTHSGRDNLYKIIPVKGDPYVVNAEHILCLKAKSRFKTHFSRTHIGGNEPVFNISVKDHCQQSNFFKREMKGWRTGVDFIEKPVRIDPYMFGVWLGDGNKDTSAITNADPEIINVVALEGEKRNLTFRETRKPNNKAATYYLYGKTRISGCNSFVNDLRHYGVLNNKHIPHDYKVNSREVRLQVLAGLMDTDGSLTHGCFDYVTELKILAEDVCFLARSLGFAAYCTPCIKADQNGTEETYHRVCISGNCSEIPVKIHYKKCPPRKQIKNHLVHGIKVEQIGVDDYYGFEVDGNHLFLLGDFTVVHNSWMLCKAAIENVKRGHKVLLITLEMNQDKTAERFDTLFTGVNMNDLLMQKDYVKRSLKAEMKMALSHIKDKVGDDMKRLMIKHFSAGTSDVNQIRAYYSQLALNGFKPDILIVDYIGEFRDFPNMKTYESRQRMMRDLRAFGVDEGHCTLTALQSNRAGRFAQDGGFIDDSEIGDSYGQVRNMDACWSINQTKKEKLACVGRIFVVKNRNGKSRYHFCYHQDPNTLAITTITDDDWKERCSAVKELKENESPMSMMEVENKTFVPNGGDDA